jgi:hypothetical protein
MKYFFHLVVNIFIWTSPVFSQFSDNFNDGILDGWSGDTGDFIINAQQQLQLNAPAGETFSWLYAPVDYSDSMQWDLYFKLDFAPSTSNQLRIYLGLTSPDISTASGYFLEIGATGDADALEFKYLNTGTPQSLASSVPGLVADEPVEIKLRVIRHQHHLWQFYNATPAIPELLFSIADNQIALGALHFFGFYARYTDTRRDKFYFDDILIDSLSADIVPPMWLDLVVTGTNTVSLVFDESLEAVTSSELSNYLLSPGNINPESALLNGSEIELTWAEPFVSQQQYTLAIQNIRDLAGNVISPEARNFTYTFIELAEPNEILITEIMADPTPVTGLPDAEFIEIYNRSGKFFNLADYQLKIGTNVRALPPLPLFPGEYIILTDTDHANEFSNFGSVIGISNFPSLTNSGTTLSLLKSTEIIHSISYTTAWYHHAQKSEGGWTLEMINPNHVCTDEENWSASIDLSGGTPGKVNSQWTLEEDRTGPKLLSVYTGDPGVIELRFDEALDTLIMQSADLYVIEPAVAISAIEFPNPRMVQLQLIDFLAEEIVYRLISIDAYDCLGNLSLITDTTLFGLVSEAEPGDLKINEIMFNPATGGSRFIEIINVSNKFIETEAIAIARISPSDQDIYLTGVSQLFNPGAIFVFASERQDILDRYMVPHPENLFATTLPSWDDQSDNITILAGGIVIDSFTYSSSWHHPVIRDQNGVSLERISPDAFSGSPSTWHSASSISGYATPTGPNSQMLTGGTGTPPFSITNKHFSPDDDGFHDYLSLAFSDSHAGHVASVWVYDLEGREIHQLLSNESLGTSTLLQWDGRNAEGQIADMGIYILFIQLWEPSGSTSEYQETCALVKR